MKSILKLLNLCLSFPLNNYNSTFFSKFLLFMNIIYKVVKNFSLNIYCSPFFHKNFFISCSDKYFFSICAQIFIFSFTSNNITIRILFDRIILISIYMVTTPAFGYSLSSQISTINNKTDISYSSKYL